MMEPAQIAEQLPEWMREAGFDAWGVTDTDLREHPDHLRRWLDAGHAGTMDWMHTHAAKRAQPEQLEPWVARIISVRMDYRPPDDDPLAVLGNPQKAYISRYALGRDYHKLIRRRLADIADRIRDAAGGQYRAFTDSAPVLEKGLAERSGLGWIGKNTLLLARESGSWFFLGEIFTDLPLPLSGESSADHCGSCSRCLEICPTDAFVGPRQLDARRCISYLTIEHRGAIDEELRAPMGNRIFGCDDCQLVCPWNRYAQPTRQADFHPRHGLADADLIDLFAWDEATFLKKTEGSAIRRTGHDGWQRNLAVALGNAPPSREIARALSDARGQASDMVAEHIDWALARQGDGGAG